jgi:hypothetical protein
VDRIPIGHRRTVAGMLVLPRGEIAVALVHQERRVGSLVIEPEVGHPPH